VKSSGASTSFSKEALEEARSFGTRVSPTDGKKRLDLRKTSLCTIDGETAKDFDDAVYAKRIGKNIEITVAIADVSHYVKGESYLDREAFLRGTSIYYPGCCIPMLPEELSNGLCSLKPNVARLAIAVSFSVGTRGAISQVSIKEAIIKSKARLTYGQVDQFFKGHLIEASFGIKKSLLLMREAANILRLNRNMRGAIDFDITESLVTLDHNGEPLSIHPEERLESHRVIEDLMVATNEVVAQFLIKKKAPALFRIHEPPNPEKIEFFSKVAQSLNAIESKALMHLTQNIRPKSVQAIMKLAEKSKYKEVLNTLMLRAMMQARYSEKNLEHFGLASKAYLHFTSPIRRYADLIVHRQLRMVCFEKNRLGKIPEHKLKEIANFISEKEVKATDLERKIDRLFATTFMSKKIGQIFSGQISAVTEFGFFVRIAKHHLEGLVHISAISKNRVNFIPERMCLAVSNEPKRFSAGDHVLVKLINVNIDRGFIDFILEPEDNALTARSKKNHRKK